MPRFAPTQPDLFAPSAAPLPPPAPEPPPLVELTDLLAMLRAADHLPWPDLPAAMAAEYRVLGLARLAGPEGARLASAIFDETERLFSAAERASHAPAAPQPGYAARLAAPPTPA